MNFREIIKQNFGVDLPIKSGFGSGYETAVILQPDLNLNHYTTTELAYLKYMGLLRNIKWEIISQSIQIYEDKTFDVMKIETIENKDSKQTICHETHYFDITGCLKTAI